jgi:hypothetical protein
VSRVEGAGDAGCGLGLKVRMTGLRSVNVRVRTWNVCKCV